MTLDWDSLIFGSYSRAEIAAAVNDPEWQALRVSLLGTTLEHKYEALQTYAYFAPAAAHLISDAQLDAWFKPRSIRVTNYVNALKRGGLIK